MDKKTGLYICQGCGIAESVDIKSLLTMASDELKINHCQSDQNLCSKMTLHKITRDIEDLNLDAVIIAACSPRHKTKEFSFKEDIQSERVNLREQVAWCSPQGDEDTLMLAEDYLRMGVAKIRNTGKPLPYIPEEINPTILVVGGGVTGITAAIEGARAGYQVLLTEKEKNLGGWAGKLYQQTPRESPYKKITEPEIIQLIHDLDHYPGISVYKESEIIEISGQPGNFYVIFRQSDHLYEIQVSSIVAAMGWTPYPAENIEEFKYTTLKNVITNIELEECFKNKVAISEKPPKQIVFIQCAGSRNDKHLPYCSNYCCSTTLKHVLYLREKYPDVLIYIVYKDIRTPGFMESFYESVQSDDLVFFTKGEATAIWENENNRLTVKTEQTLFNEDIEIMADLVVLAVGMTPSGTEDLNLKYRQGKGLPVLKYDFPDSHFICFPYETRRTGIYAAGALRSPAMISECCNDARGAMLKAIQCTEMIRRGESVHPRSGDQSTPDLYLERCTECKRCTEECPFGTYDETPTGTPLANPTRCRRCGICLGACPERIINFEDFSINSVSSMIKSVHIPDEFEEKPRILVFLCENDAYPAFDMAGYNKLKISPYIRIIPVRCIGSVNKVWISDALSRGYDGILQIGCKPGDDYQCHFIHGSELTLTRGENIQETLESMMLEPERIHTEFIEIDEYYKVPEIINKYVEQIEEIGPNPFKEL